MLSTILVPFDGSALAERAFPYATALARAGALAEALRADLIPLQVIHPLPPRLKAFGTQLAASHPRDERARGQRYLGAMGDRVRRAGHRAVAHIAIGSPAAVIAEVAGAEGCDLIAMATHGRGGLARVAHGGAATGVLQRTGTPTSSHGRLPRNGRRPPPRPRSGRERGMSPTPREAHGGRPRRRRSPALRELEDDSETARSPRWDASGRLCAAPG